jgi:hypothetical protein
MSRSCRSSMRPTTGRSHLTRKAVKPILHVFFLFTFISLGAAADVSQHAQEDAIREAVFRYLFKHNAAIQQNPRAYCISLGDNDVDPPDEFMRRFDGHKPSVKKVSECHADPFKGVVDKRTNQPGLIFRVRTISWISATEVKVTGGYFQDGLSASGNTLTLKKKQGKWNVTNDKMNWIS